MHVALVPFLESAIFVLLVCPLLVLLLLLLSRFSRVRLCVTPQTALLYSKVNQQFMYMSACLISQVEFDFLQPMDCGPPESSVHGIFQARILDWVAISSSRGSSQPRDLNPHRLCLLLWQADSLPLSHQGSTTPPILFFGKEKLQKLFLPIASDGEVLSSEESGSLLLFRR